MDHNRTPQIRVVGTLHHYNCVVVYRDRHCYGWNDQTNRSVFHWRSQFTPIDTTITTPAIVLFCSHSFQSCSVAFVKSFPALSLVFERNNEVFHATQPSLSCAHRHAV